MSSGTNTAAECLSSESKTGYSQTRPSSVETFDDGSNSVTPQHIRDWLMSSQRVGLASHTARLESEKVQPTSVKDGLLSSKQFARLSPDGSWVKTSEGYSQLTMDNTLQIFSGTWPKAGMTAGGVCYRRMDWELRTNAKGYGLLPTLAVHDSVNRTQFNPIETSNGTIRHLNKAGTQSRASLSHVVKYATLQARDYRTGTTARWEQACKGLRSCNLNDQLGGMLNPNWTDWFMGFPIGWTGLEALEMGKFQQWLQQHGVC